MRKYSDIFSLTKREKEILELVIKGYSCVEIQEKLFIANSTVKTALNHIYTKLGCSGHGTAKTQAIIKYLVEIGELNKKWIEN